jgi:hypothetical protein
VELYLHFSSTSSWRGSSLSTGSNLPLPLDLWRRLRSNPDQLITEAVLLAYRASIQKVLASISRVATDFEIKKILCIITTSHPKMGFEPAPETMGNTQHNVGTMSQPLLPTFGGWRLVSYSIILLRYINCSHALLNFSIICNP